MERDEKDTPRSRSGVWRQLFNTPSYTKFFSPAEEETFQYTIPGTLEGIVNRGLSSSRVAILTDAEKEIFVKDVEAIVQRGEGKVWIDEEKGTFQYPQRTDIVISKRV